MDKQVQIDASNIQKQKYKTFIFNTFDSIIDSIFDYDCVANLNFSKEDSSFIISFTMKICKDADMLWILIKEYLSSIIETDDSVQLQITEIEQNGTVIVYKLYNHSPLSR